MSPGYRIVSAGISSYISHRSLCQTSNLAIVDEGYPSQGPTGKKFGAGTKCDQAYAVEEIAHPPVSHDGAFAAEAEADCAK